MRIKLNIDYTAYLDGFHLVAFKAGQEAEIPIHIAQVLLEDGRASLPEEAKMEGGAPENKMMPGPAKNKATFKRGGRRK